MKSDLTGRVIIITGASSGIGAATAIHCARAGMDVVLNARREDRLASVARDIEALGRRAVMIVGDVTAPGMSDRLLDAAERHFGFFDAVFANAGYGLERPVLETSMDENRQIFDVNFFSCVDLLQRAARRLVAQQRPGHLLMCSSCVAKFTLPFYGPYAATKAAQNSVCRAMRLELEPCGIEVTSVHPASTDTEFSTATAQHRGATVVLPACSVQPVARHAPRYFVQSADRVARAVVRCLRRPRAEVWTSFMVRFAAALFTFWPGLSDVAMRRVRKVIVGRSVPVPRAHP